MFLGADTFIEITDRYILWNTIQIVYLITLSVRLKGKINKFYYNREDYRIGR